MGIRIPRSFAAEIDVEDGATVDLSIADGRLVVRPVRPRPILLEDLLRKVNRKNLHGEADLGGPAGREAW